MAKKERRGRKPMKDSEKLKVCSIYLRDAEKEAIVKKYDSLSNAVRSEILPKVQ